MTDKERRKIEMLAEDMVQSATALREHELDARRKRAEFLDFVRSLQNEEATS
jgi:hypothetical protein